MKKVRIGVLGSYRGTSMINYCKRADHTEVVANYANEHAPFAIRCLKKGLHVFSEVLPAQNMKEAVALVEAVEESGLVYAYGENYCYMPAPLTFLRAGGKASCTPASPQSNPPTNPNLNHLNFHQQDHLSYISP